MRKAHGTEMNEPLSPSSFPPHAQSVFFYLFPCVPQQGVSDILTRLSRNKDSVVIVEEEEREGEVLVEAREREGGELTTPNSSARFAA